MHARMHACTYTLQPEHIHTSLYGLLIHCHMLTLATGAWKSAQYTHDTACHMCLNYGQKTSGISDQLIIGGGEG